jgi:hypothetical protein
MKKTGGISFYLLEVLHVEGGAVAEPVVVELQPAPFGPQHLKMKEKNEEHTLSFSMQKLAAGKDINQACMVHQC